MIEFLFVLKDIILLVFVVIMVGFIIQKKFKLDLQTIAKLNIYVFVPAFIFVKLYNTDISVSIFMKVLLFTLLFVFILYILGFIAARMMKLDKLKKVTFTNSIIFLILEILESQLMIWYFVAIHLRCQFRLLF